MERLDEAHANSLSKEIFNIIKLMSIGEVTKPIKRKNSVIFLKLNDKRISKVENLNLTELKKIL